MTNAVPDDIPEAMTRAAALARQSHAAPARHRLEPIRPAVIASTGIPEAMTRAAALPRQSHAAPARHRLEPIRPAVIASHGAGRDGVAGMTGGRR
jgi:hypothetical protein